MNKPKRILVVEIKTIDNPGLDSDQPQTISVCQDNRTNNMYLSWDFLPIKLEIRNAVVRLGSNFRHPLYFDVQVLTHDNRPRSKRQRRRPRKNN